ncbi:MAG: aldehyde dehydrogenase (NAD+), partial [Pirellulaceae bacterium]
MLDKTRSVDPQKIRNQLFINGEFVDAVDGATISVINPHNNKELTAVAQAKAPDVDKAVAAARAAFPAWKNMNPSDRGRLIMKLADKLEDHFDEFTELESLDTGHPIADTRRLDLPRTVL